MIRTSMFLWVCVSVLSTVVVMQYARLYEGITTLTRSLFMAPFLADLAQRGRLRRSLRCRRAWRNVGEACGIP
jgi:hypothetical protein